MKATVALLCVLLCALRLWICYTCRFYSNFCYSCAAPTFSFEQIKKYLTSIANLLSEGDGLAVGLRHQLEQHGVGVAHLQLAQWTGGRGVRGHTGRRTAEGEWPVPLERTEERTSVTDPMHSFCAAVYLRCLPVLRNMAAHKTTPLTPNVFFVVVVWGT